MAEPTNGAEALAQALVKLVNDDLVAQMTAIEEAIAHAVLEGKNGVLLVYLTEGGIEVGPHPLVPYGTIYTVKQPVDIEYSWPKPHQDPMYDPVRMRELVFPLIAKPTNPIVTGV
jgi:hypothetical protein